MHFVCGHERELDRRAPASLHGRDLHILALGVDIHNLAAGASGRLLDQLPHLRVLFLHPEQPYRGSPSGGTQVVLEGLHAVRGHLQMGHPPIKWLHDVEDELLPHLPELPLQLRDVVFLKKLSHRIAIHAAPQGLLQRLPLLLQELLLLVLRALLRHLLAAGDASNCTPQSRDLPLGGRLRHLRLDPILPRRRGLLPVLRRGLGLLLLAGKVLHAGTLGGGGHSGRASGRPEVR
mmetsp:Transcript_59564/g.159362  ORF Transcript_59564/g.159362 Transcript_59564/m.159362 type:complete len:234 (-) Transcript_59564:17-718(-)